MGLELWPDFGDVGFRGWALLTFMLVYGAVQAVVTRSKGFRAAWACFLLSVGLFGAVAAADFALGPYAGDRHWLIILAEYSVFWAVPAALTVTALHRLVRTRRSAGILPRLGMSCVATVVSLPLGILPFLVIALLRDSIR
jgi:hypothetical protein